MIQYMTRDMKKDTILHTAKGTYVRRLMNICSSAYEHMFIGTWTYVLEQAKQKVRPGRTMSPLTAHWESACGGLRTMLLLIILTLGTGTSWGQTDFSGTYYLGNSNGYSGTISNNFYLIPSVGCYYGGDPNTPHLTTYRSNHADESLWRIKKTGDYYYIIHGKGENEKYLSANPQYDGTTGNNVGRLRVHLESKTTGSEDPYLFMIVPNVNGGYNIKHKDMSDKINNSTTTYLDPAGGNVDNKNATNARTMSTTNGTVNVGGTIGYWTDEPAARWIFEDKITRPTISYSSGNVIITYSTSATIYYTTDGSDPTDSNNSNRFVFTGTSSSIPFENVAVVKAAAYIGDEYSNIATYVCVHTGNPYLLQSVDNINFYMVAGDNNSNSKPTVNTSSLPQAGMSWSFEDAGNVNGVQCYYVKNTSANGYLRRDGNNFYIESTTANNNDYKFAVIPYINDNGTIGGFNLYNIGKAQYVYKGNSNDSATGNGSNGAVNLSTDRTQAVAQWNLILVENKSFPSPVTLSDNSSATYYTLASSNTPAQLITSLTGTSAYVKTSTGDNDNQKWYFKHAGTDEWASYYYILNAVTGEAIYFGKEAASTTISDALEMGPLPENPMDNYKFALAHTVTDGEYYIVPKPLAQFTKTKYTAVWYVNTTSSLQTQSNRANNQIKWQISEVEDYVAPPYITYDVATNTATISSTYPGATIYYTTDGSEATASSPNSVAPVAPSSTASTSFVLTAGVTTIRAIVSKEGAGTSSESTYSVAFQVTLSDAAADQRPYLIQSQNNGWTIDENTTDFHFYMIPGDEASGITKVNTTSLFRPSMEWHFLNAGIEDGVQYYYVVNNANSKYLAYDGTNNVYLDDFTEDNKFKFKILESPTAGTYNIYPYGQNIIINKNTHNANSGAINTANYNASNANSGNTRWKFVLRSDLDTTAPFTVSVPASDTYSYYKIASVGSSGHYIVPGETNATTSNSASDNMNWYFEEAQVATSSDWCTYYHIRNAVTGDYLYFSKDANNAGACLEMKNTIDSGNEDRYMFTWAKTADTNVNYYIIPKLLKDVSLNQFSSLRKHDNNTSILTNVTRGAGNFAWTFESSTFTCAQPEITWSAHDNGYVITSDTPGAKIYYTTSDNSNTLEWTEYTEGTAIPTPTTPTTIKAIAARSADHSDKSGVAEFPVTQVESPEFDYSAGNNVAITCATEGAKIYYVIDGTIDSTDPTNGTTLYERPLTDEDGIVGKTIKAIAVKPGSVSSTVVTSETIVLRCATPVIKRGSDNASFTIECSFPTSNVTIKYTTASGSGTPADPTTGTIYSGAVTGITLPITVSAIAIAEGYGNSEIETKTLEEGLVVEDDIYLISSDSDFETFLDMVNNNENGEAAAHYKLMVDVSASGVDPITTSFTGTFDGGMHTISSLGHALFNTIDGGKVKNVILDNVAISAGENTGAICNEATGDSRIYNCGINSGLVSGSVYVGGLVGLLDGSSRVINCYSYANVSGGSEVGGIVGHNNVATTATNLQTMVMNCMFYGEVSGSSIAPIYNGEIITNDGDANGVNNFNYFRLESSYIQNTAITKVYNCALGAETRFLQRFEFFRHLLNSNRELAAWWATGDVGNKDEMMKWVLEPSQIGSSTPYPILKTPGRYASVVNYTPSTIAYNEDHRNEGRKLTSEGDGGVLHVTIRMGDGAVFDRPFKNTANAATITTSSVDLTITDKDFEHFNFNYGKVQLPYYNDFGTQNYRDNRVVTGWKIVVITGGTTGSYSIDADDVTYTNGELTNTPYNFADRKCTDKDLYSVSGRVFNQGAYWDVPEGVTAITIEPYWGKAVYLADAYWDVTYKNNGNDAMATAADVITIGGDQRSSTFNGQTVYTSIGNAIADKALYENIGETLYSARSVYDYAVVLVGNYHHNGTIAAGGKPYTVTSVDLDGDNEPDYSFMLRFNGRTGFHSVRYDFLNLIGLGMAQKTTGGTGSYNFGIMQPRYWFEVTNTALFRVTQFEYSPTERTATKKPIILQGGVIEQWVTQQQDAGDKVSYFHVGGNVWFKEFHRGSHQDNAGKSTPHPPVSVTGGDFDKFYLTGLYQSQAAIYDDNAECYINGGRFGEVAGAGMEGIGTSNGKGNVTWIIDNADIENFYGGGINYDKPVHGNIHTIISNSHVGVFCGGPKFGDMENERTVKTTATGCTFGTYFGAGYGGNSYNRYAPRNHNNILNFPHNDSQAGNHTSWNNWLEAYYKQDYSSTYKGISTQFDYQFLPMSGNLDNVARIFVEYVGFSLATTHDVTSDLTGCIVTGNFYGGGSLGKVAGDVTSTLTNCTVNGSVFGAGYSASLPTVEVMDVGFQTEPYYYTELGTYRTAVFPATTTYTWQHGDAISIDKTNHILYTTADLTNLGTVTGTAKLTINGTTTTIAESVYGGGEESGVGGEESSDVGNTVVTINNGTIGTSGLGGTTYGNVYGGGKGKAENEGVENYDDLTLVKMGFVKGNTNVTINGGNILHNVYGGGAFGSVGTYTYADADYHTANPTV